MWPNVTSRLRPLLPDMRQAGCLAAATALCLLAGCWEDPMNQRGRIKPLQPSVFFADGRTARPPVQGTIARGMLLDNPPYQTGREADGQLVAQVPVTITLDLLRRGQSQFNAFCAPCHGQIGDGTGMIVERGFPQPPTFHEQRLRDVPDGHIFDVITHGFGTMQPYRHQVDVPDRWAITAYLRALQRSQNAGLQDVPEQDRHLLEAQP